MRGIAKRVGLATIVAGCVLCMSLASAAPQTEAQTGSVLYVSTSGDCGGMEPCYTHPQDAVNAAPAGSVIKLAGGTYSGVRSQRSPSGYDGPSTIAQVSYISKTLTLRGGYTTDDWVVSDPETNATKLDAEGQGRVLFITDTRVDVGGSMSTGQCGRGECRSLGQAIAPAIEGLHLSGGAAAGLGGGRWGQDAGGGMYVFGAAPTVANCQLTGNIAEAGGAIYLFLSDSTLSGSTISNNTTCHDGGGIFVDISTPILHGNRISSNQSYGNGGGLYLWFSSATLNGNTIRCNTAGEGGGLLQYQSEALLTNDVVADNRAEVRGGGIHIENSSGRYVHTTIARNAGGDGSGVNVTDAPEFPSSSVYLTNTILVSHTVGIMVALGNSARLEGTLWFGNEKDTGGDGTITLGTVNVYGDPMLTDPDAGDYHLSLGSAAIDRGVRSGIDADIDGEARPDGCFADLGADEYQGSRCYLAYLPVAVRRD